MSEAEWIAAGWPDGAPCLCVNGNDEAAATTAIMDCPACGTDGYGPETFIPPARMMETP